MAEEASEMSIEIEGFEYLVEGVREDMSSIVDYWNSLSKFRFYSFSIYVFKLFVICNLILLITKFYIKYVDFN